MKSASLGRKPLRVKAVFIWPFAIVLTFILGAFAATSYFVEARVRDRDLAERMAAVAKLVDQKLGKDTSAEFERLYLTCVTCSTRPAATFPKRPV